MPRPTGERRDRPTMHDVAEHAGVSLKSVSRVINDESGASQQTRTRVWTAIRELGYQRNDTAHALRRRDGRSACLGVVLDDVGNTFAAAVHSRGGTGRQHPPVPGVGGKHARRPRH